jgi:GT2 family glycosyltransferase
MSYAAIRSYYDIADEIILAIDKDRKAWNRRKYEINIDEFYATIRKIDVKNKIKFLQDNFASEIEERNYISKHVDDQTYLIAINSDEILTNPQEFKTWLDQHSDLKDDITCESYIVYKLFDTRFLVVEPFEKNYIGTRFKNNYRNRKRTFNDNRVITCPAKILHYSWGRSEEEVKQKLENSSFDKTKFLELWNSIDLQNYNTITNFHPVSKNIWKTLRLVTSEKIVVPTEVKAQIIQTAKKDKLSIIVPIKNQWKIVRNCLESISKHYKMQEVILIDDGSTEQQTIDVIKDYVKKNNWKMIRNEKSIGHSKACELGVKNTQYETMFLINSDVVLSKNSLNLMNEVLNSDEKIAVVGPTTSSTSGIQQNAEAFKNRFIWTIEQIEKFAEKIKDEKIADIDFVGGFGFGIKRSVWEALKGFDKALNCYGNEKELQIRIRRQGFRTVWVKNSYVHHLGKMSYMHEKQINIARCQKDGDDFIIRKHGSLS